MQLLAIAYNGAGSFTFGSQEEFKEKSKQYNAEEWELSLDEFECDGVFALNHYINQSNISTIFEGAEYIEEQDMPREIVSMVCELICDIDDLLPKLKEVIYYPEDEYRAQWQGLNVGDEPNQVPEVWAMYIDYDRLYRDDDLSGVIGVCGKFFIANPYCLRKA